MCVCGICIKGYLLTYYVFTYADGFMLELQVGRTGQHAQVFGVWCVIDNWSHCSAAETASWYWMSALCHVWDTKL